MGASATTGNPAKTRRTDMDWIILALVTLGWIVGALVESLLDRDP